MRGKVSDERVVEELAAHGPYRVVVHNAATGVIRPALETEDKHWDWTLNANARALLSLARATAPEMEESGSIVAISSLGSQRVLENYVLVGTSKAALESVVRYLGVELAPAASASTASRRASSTPARSSWFPNKEEMLATVEANARRTARRAGGHRGGGLLPLLAGRRDGVRPDARRRRRLLARGVGPMEPTEHNRRAFEERHRARAEPVGLPPIVKATLGDLTGKRVLHLQCGTGEASAELAEQGAVVTAVDRVRSLLDEARERWPKILWIQADATGAAARSCGAAASTSSTRPRA